MSRYLISLLTLVAVISAHCPRHQLVEGVNSYLSSQTSGEPSSFRARWANDSTWEGYYENAKPVNLSSAVINQALPITHNRTLYDTTLCATYSEVVVNSTTNPYVIGTQLRFTEHQITKVESIVTQPGDWLFNITGYAYWTSVEDWSEVPEEQRDTRETIKAAADAYCDLFNNPNTTVPWGTPCVRLEGGLYGDPGPNGSCAVGVPTGVPLTNRRYVIDESVGAVDVFLDFGQSKWPDTHEFRIENGKIRYVHTMTHCDVANCGLGNGTALRRSN